MPKNHYTIIIIPSKKGATIKISLSSFLAGVISVSLIITVLLSTYSYYDYIKLKREKRELISLRKQTKEQMLQIEALAEKVNKFNVKMDELRQLDKQIRAMANINEKRKPGQILGLGGSIGQDKKLDLNLENDRKNIIANIEQNINRLADDATEQKKRYQELIGYLKKLKSIMAVTPSIWPVRGLVTSEFGNRTSPFGRGYEFHKGIDIAANIGTPVIAPSDGIVADVSYEREMGHIVKLNHGYGITTWYGHLMRSVVKKGAVLKRGDLIGYLGNSGRTSGPHLHYSIFINDVPVNPRKYLN